MRERDYWLGFSVFPGIGPGKFKLLLDSFGSAKNAWNLPRDDLCRIIGPITSEKFDLFRSSFTFEQYIAQLEQKHVSFVTLSDHEYPQQLKSIKNPPFVLYSKGNKDLLVQDSARFIGIVGTRKVTSYGIEVTKSFTRELIQKNFIIVSGLALGVDALAHKTTIEYNGATIAVLGSGVDICYPIENNSIYRAILEKNGLIVSELPVSMPPSRGSFPSRNRIVAGLCSAVVVTEGAEDSGSLITAGYALEHGKKVFAVPGPITSALSKGPYQLLQKGAIMVLSADDIIKELAITSNELTISKQDKKGDTEEEQHVLDLLQREPMTFDELAKGTSIQSSALGSLLTMTEIKGMISHTDGKFTVRS